MNLENNKNLKVLSVRLVEEPPLLSSSIIDSPKSACNCIGDYISSYDREVVCVLFLSASGSPIGCNIASIGSLSSSIASPREIFKAAILANAHSIILIHNHPSGNLTPSKYDEIVTDKISKAGELLDIPLTDHIIVKPGNQEYYSFKEHTKYDYIFNKECVSQNDKKHPMNHIH